MTAQSTIARRRPFVAIALALTLAACSVGSLDSRLLSDNPKTRERAMLRLKGVSPETRERLIPTMLAALQSGDGRRANRAEEVLIAIGEPAIDGVRGELTASDPYLRTISANILGEIAARPDVVVPALTTALSDHHPLVREEAAHALGHFGARAASAVAELQKAQRDPVPEVSDAATEALSRINAPPVTQPSNPA